MGKIYDYFESMREPLPHQVVEEIDLPSNGGSRNFFSRWSLKDLNLIKIKLEYTVFTKKKRKNVNTYSSGLNRSNTPLISFLGKLWPRG